MWNRNLEVLRLRSLVWYSEPARQPAPRHGDGRDRPLMEEPEGHRKGACHVGAQVVLTPRVMLGDGTLALSGRSDARSLMIGARADISS